MAAIVLANHGPAHLATDSGHWKMPAFWDFIKGHHDRLPKEARKYPFRFGRAGRPSAAASTPCGATTSSSRNCRTLSRSVHRRGETGFNMSRWASSEILGRPIRTRASDGEPILPTMVCALVGVGVGALFGAKGGGPPGQGRRRRRSPWGRPSACSAAGSSGCSTGRSPPPATQGSNPSPDLPAGRPPSRVGSSGGCSPCWRSSSAGCRSSVS